MDTLITPIQHYVYLCGPMTGCTWGQCSDWRTYVEGRLNAGIGVLSPLRHKTYKEVNGVIKHVDEESLMSSAKAMTERDRNDVKRADMVLANFLGAEDKSCGSMIEFGWADAQRIPIVMAVEAEGNPHDHPLVTTLAGWRVETLDDAIHVVNAVLTPGV